MHPGRSREQAGVGLTLKRRRPLRPVPGYRPATGASKQIAALAQLPAVLPNPAIFRHVHDLDELTAGNLQSASRWQILGITGDPDRIDAELPGQGKQKNHRSRSKAMPPMRLMHRVTNVTSVSLKVWCRSNAQVDRAQLLLGID